MLVNKVLDYPREHFNLYAYLIYKETENRGYRTEWERFQPRDGAVVIVLGDRWELFKDWHNDRYMRQCLSNLQEKADCGAIPAEEWKRITDRWPEWR